MWVFLVTEIMFFGGLFMAYIVYRTMYPEAWVKSSQELNVVLGAHEHRRPDLQQFDDGAGGARGADRIARGPDREPDPDDPAGFGASSSSSASNTPRSSSTISCPGPHFGPTPALPFGSEIFFSLYFIMTGIHAVHMIVGIGIMLVMLVMAIKGKFTPEYYTPMEISGLYWHFVDIVWIFLFPAAVPARVPSRQGRLRRLPCPPLTSHPFAPTSRSSSACSSSPVSRCSRRATTSATSTRS